MADGASQVKQHAYARVVDPTPLAGLRPGAAAAAIAGCLAVGGGATYCAQQGVDPIGGLTAVVAPAHTREALRAAPQAGSSRAATPTTPDRHCDGAGAHADADASSACTDEAGSDAADGATRAVAGTAGGVRAGEPDRRRDFRAPGVIDAQQARAGSCRWSGGVRRSMTDIAREEATDA